MLFFNVRGRWRTQNHRAWPAPPGAELWVSGFLSSQMHFGLFSFHLITLMIAAVFPDAFLIYFLSQTTARMAGNVKIAAEKQGDAHLKPGSPTACACSCSTEVFTCPVSGANEIWWAFCLFQGGAGRLFFCPLHTAGSVHQLIHAKRTYNELVILWACEVAARQIWARFRCLIDRKLITWQLNWHPGDSSEAVKYSGIQQLGKGQVFMR